MSADDATTHLESDDDAERESSGELTHLEFGEEPSSFQRVNLPGPLAGRFVVVGGIAGGAEADLLVVRPHDGGVAQVVKIYRLRLEPPPQDVRERIAAADAAHVVRVGPPETWRGVTYEVMEHCALGSLRSLIDREGPRLHEGLVRQVLVELHAALAHIHAPAVGLVHRDLKPANVLVRAREPLDLVLADFGLSEIIGDHSKLFLSAKRTIAYAAPEATHGNINRKSDWWSLGMCVAELLLGAHPILRHLGPGATEQSVSQWISDQPIPLDDLDGRWRNLCAGLLTKDVDDRWGEPEVRRWLDGDDPQVRRPAAPAATATPRIAPFVFSALSDDGYESYDDPRLLAAAFGRHWGEALAIVSGERTKRGEARRLATFVKELGLTRAQAILLEEGDDEARLVRLRLALDPECEPVFRGIDLAGDGLRRFAARAAESDSAGNAATCAALLEARVLSAHAAQPARRDWASFDAQWLASDQYVVQELTRLRTQARPQQAGAGSAGGRGLLALDTAGAAAIRARLLQAIVEPQAAGCLDEAADAARADEHARTQAWFDELATRQATGRESLGLAMVLVAVHTAATEQAEEEARRRLARERQQRARAEREALEQEMTAKLASLPPINVALVATDDQPSLPVLGCAIWFGVTMVAVAFAAMGVISDDFMGGNPIVFAPFALLAAWIIQVMRQQAANERHAQERRRSDARAAERVRIEASYTARIDELPSENH